MGRRRRVRAQDTSPHTGKLSGFHPPWGVKGGKGGTLKRRLKRLKIYVPAARRRLSSCVCACVCPGSPCRFLSAPTGADLSVGASAPGELADMVIDTRRLPAKEEQRARRARSLYLPSMCASKTEDPS